MSASQLDKFKVDHLFLLVGENPLPNYIAARTLLKDNGTVYLVFTNQTKEQKKCIEEGLKNQKHIRFNIVRIDLVKYESNAHHIYERVQKKVPDNDSVGLNYTGGTKAMAVHAYKAIYERRPDAVFSYIDSRSLKIRIDAKPLDEFDIPIELSLKELFKLHNNNYWLDHKPPQFNAFLPVISEKLVDIYCDRNLAEKWKTWLKKELQHLTKQIWENREDIKQIQSRVITTNDLPEKIENIISVYLDTLTNQEYNETNQENEFKSLSEICKWLDGAWLESYVLQQVKEIEKRSKDFNIKESGMSFYIKDPEYTRKNETEEESEDEPRFEFDVAFIKGYQLFAISCATSQNHKSCKQKLFEAHLRARQLGGDEARTALVCCSNSPENIEDEIRFAVRDKKIRVFGIKDLPDLADHLETWIRNIETNN
jgi:hypothetical protein